MGKKEEKRAKRAMKTYKDAKVNRIVIHPKKGVGLTDKPHKKDNGQGVMPPGLDLNAFRVANVARSTDPKGFDHPLDAWSVAEWTNAGAGEMGEACNLAKKLLRIDKKLRGNIKADDKKREKVINKLAKELCDVIAYADLTLARIGRNTSDELVKVYNAKSKQLGYDFKL